MSAEDRPDYNVNVCLDEISEDAKGDLTLVDKRLNNVRHLIALLSNLYIDSKLQ